MIRTDFPTPLEFDIRFGRYTLRDLLRIGVPTLLGWVAAGLPGMVAGAVAGVGVAELEVKGKHVDEHVTDHLRERLLEQYGNEVTVDTVHGDDGVAFLSTGAAVGVVQVDSVDLRNAEEATQEANRDTVLDLLKTVEYPVELHSRQRHQDLSQYSGVDGTGVVTDHYVVVKAYPDTGDGFWPWTADSQSDEDLGDTVQNRCQTIQDRLTGGDMAATWLAGDDLTAVITEFQHDVPDTAPEDTSEEAEASSQQIAAVSRFPPRPPIQWLADVLNVDAPGTVDLVQRVEPVTEEQRTRLDRAMGRLRAELFGADRPSRKTRLKRMLAEYEELQDAEVLGERLVNYGVYLVARGDTEADATATMEDVERVLRRFQAETWTPLVRTRSAAQTVSPLSHDVLDRTQIVPARAAASGFPFAAYDTIESGGVVFGTDTRSGLPLVLDRFSWEAGHVARMGKIGSGKSYAAKLALLRALDRYDDLQVFIVDPKQEYETVSAAADGQHIVVDDVDTLDIEGTTDGRVLRYTVADRSQDNTEQLVDAVRDVYRQASQDTQKTIVLLDEAHRLLRTADGRTVLGELVREGRDRNVAVTMITQNASDFTRSQEGRDILKNVNGYVFMRHQDVDTGVQDFFTLSDAEAVQLRKLRTGTDAPFSEAVLRGPVNTTLRIEATDREHATITDDTASDTNSTPMTDTTDTTTDTGTASSTDTGDTTTATDSSRADGGSTAHANSDPSSNSADTRQASTGDSPSTADYGSSDRRSKTTESTARKRRQRERNDAFMDLPEPSTLEMEEPPDDDAPAEDLLPEVLPGWECQQTSTDRWAVPVAEDWIVGTYIDPVGDRYKVHISRWQPSHVTYAMDELFGVGEPVRFDVWTARTQFVFGVVVLDGTVDQAKTLLAASPALSTAHTDWGSG